ncbi:MAG: hypothetical protein VXZ72_03225 [Chlamydiota bacterium]|nr:hypothetical protein [Chlamydiota bacterium]
MHYLFTFFFLFSCLHADSPDALSHELDALSLTIQQLEELRNESAAHAERAENRADRLQFNPNTLIEAQKLWKEADVQREMVKQYDEKIQQLRNQHLEKKTARQAPIPSDIQGEHHTDPEAPLQK